MSEVELFPKFGRTKRGAIQEVAKKNPSKVVAAMNRNAICCFAGVDEVGRGPLAGPVVACVCILPKGYVNPAIKDSKLLSEEEIIRLYHELTALKGIDFAFSMVDAEVIDRINILQATLLAMRQAVDGLKKTPEMLLVDGNKSPHTSIPCITVVKGDVYCLPVSAASIIAKYVRDTRMREYDAQWPEYGFASHKGYGTALHMKRLKKHGPCPIHRKSFGPVRQMLAVAEPELLLLPKK